MAKISIYGELNNVTDGVIADSLQIKGGYKTLTTNQRTALNEHQKTDGTLVYDTDENKSYRWSNTGWVELPTDNELNYIKGVTSEIQTQLDNKAPSESPEFTGTPTAPTAAVGTSTTQIANTAFVKAEINSVLAASDAMIFKGTLGTSGTITTLPDNHRVGDTYKVITAGTYAGNTCEVGDMIVCITSGTSANNAHWTVIQTNTDGHVTGPVSAVADHIPVFDGTTGKFIKDSGFTIEKVVTKDSAVGQKLNNNDTAEIFNDYTNNTTNIPYSHIEGLTNDSVVKGYQLINVDITRKIVTIDLTDSSLVVDNKFDAIQQGDNFFVLYQTPELASDKTTILHPKTDDASLGLNYKRSRGTVESVSEVKSENGKITVDITLSAALKENIADIVNSCTIDDYEPIGKMYSNNTDSDNNYIQYKKQDFIDYRTNNECGALGKLIINGGIYGTHRLDFRDLDGELLNVSAHILGVHNKAFIQSFAGGYGSEALGYASIAYGQHCIATGERSFCFGYENIASGNESTAFGASNKASAEYSVAFGYKNTASGLESTAFGRNNIASGDYSTAFGFFGSASGIYSTSSGYKTKSSNIASFSAGYETEASGHSSTAIGRNTIASKPATFASGCNTNAIESYSAAFNEGTIANRRNQTVVGSYNDESVRSALFVVGNGWGESKDADGKVQTIRSNALTVRTTNYSSGDSVEQRQEKTFVDVYGHLNVARNITASDVNINNIKASGKLTLGALNIENTIKDGKHYLTINNLPFFNYTNNILNVKNIVTGSSALSSYGDGASSIGCGLCNEGYAGQIALGLYNKNDVWFSINEDSSINTWNTLLTVGNGSKDKESGEITRSNAFALSRKGEGVFAGDVYVNYSNGSSKKLATEEFVNNVKSDLSTNIQPAKDVATQLKDGKLTIGNTTFTEAQLKKILKFIESIED